MFLSGQALVRGPPPGTGDAAAARTALCWLVIPEKKRKQIPLTVNEARDGLVKRPQPWPAGPNGGRRDEVIYYQYRHERARRTLRGNR